jgi:serine/threonine-protein kinase HipA
VVGRFDLLADGSYVGIEDFCVLDGKRSHGRYDGSYEGIARRMAEYVSPAALGRAKDQFALMVAYNCAVGNGDAHLKNFSVIYRHPEDEVTLAPAYDIVSTLPYTPKDTLALELSDSKEFPDRTRLLKFVRQVTGKTGKAAQKLLDQAAVGVDVALRHAAAYGREHRDAAEFVRRISAVMTAGKDRLAP